MQGCFNRVGNRSRINERITSMRTKRWSRGASLVAFAFFAFCFLICLIIAVVCFTDAAGGLDGLDIVRGKFHVSSEAEDPVTGISGAVVLRTTKMLQYREKSYEHTDGSYTYEVEEVWEEKHIDSFSQGSQKYDNPDFPEELKTEAFYGKAGIGNIPLSKWLLSCFRYEETSYLGDDAMIAPTDLPDDLLYEYGLVQTSPGHFVTEGMSENDVGCVVVEYSVVNPALYDTVFTAAGKYDENGEFGTHDDTHILYTRDIPDDELISEFKNKSGGDGIFFLAAAIISAIAAIIFWLI